MHCSSCLQFRQPRGVSEARHNISICVVTWNLQYKHSILYTNYFSHKIETFSAHAMLEVIGFLTNISIKHFDNAIVTKHRHPFTTSDPIRREIAVCTVDVPADPDILLSSQWKAHPTFMEFNRCAMVHEELVNKLLHVPGCP